MFRKVLTVLPLCTLCLAVNSVQGQNRKVAGPPSAPTAKPASIAVARLVEPSTIAEMQLATLDKYSGKAVTSPVINRTTVKKRAQGSNDSLKEEMRNSFVISGGYLYQRVDDLPVHRVQGVSVMGFYYPVPWVGVGGEYQYGRGTTDSTAGALPRQDKLRRHVAVFGPEFSGYPGDKVRVFFHPLFGWAKERMSTRIGNTTATTEDTNFAMALGGGLDVRLTRHIFLRPVQLDYLGIRRNNSWQNNWRLSTGVGVRP